MATSPNYAWAEPDNSSLVKNGASDIRTLGDAIDTSVWNIGFGQAGKNKIINGDCFINQRAFSSSTSSGNFLVDRFVGGHSGGTVTYSVQQFTPGAAPVAGYEAKQFMRLAVSGQSAAGDFTNLNQEIEDVRTFAGQTVTISFWAKATSGTPSISVDLLQKFGSGGSPSASVSTAAGKNAITTSWARYSYTVAVPSISGKTLGTTENTSSLRLRVWVSAGSTYNTETTSLGTQANTFDIWGVQAEYGSKATPFETATGTIQGELAACQRYYWRSTNSSFVYFGTGFWNSSTLAYIIVNNPVAMRSNPTSIDSSGTGVFDGAGTAVTSLALTQGGVIANLIAATTASGGVQYRPAILRADPSNNYLGFSAEL